MSERPAASDAAPRLSVILITKNEAQRIGPALQSVAFADEIVVVDSGSTDGTVQLCEAAGARVIQTTDWPGFGRQKQRALDAARGTWVLAIDADEWLDEALAAAVRDVVARPIDAQSPAGLETSRISAFCGRWMRHGGWYPDRGLRLFQRGRARFSEDLVHERVIVDGPVARLPGLLLHDSIPTLADAIDKMNRYSGGRARDLLAKGRKGGLGTAIGHGLWAFIRTYLVKRGFLDGRIGFVLAVHNAETSYYRYLKMWLDEAPLPRPLPHPGPAPRPHG
jgi:glycosyltransferase involved in cell wall biosynthesis